MADGAEEIPQIPAKDYRLGFKAASGRATEQFPGQVPDVPVKLACRLFLGFLRSSNQVPHESKSSSNC